MQSRRIAAAALIGGGAFNFYDGVVQHVIFHLHLVDEKACSRPQIDNSLSTCHQNIPFEIVWILAGAAIITAGVLWWRKLATPKRASRGRPPRAPKRLA